MELDVSVIGAKQQKRNSNRTARKSEHRMTILMRGRRVENIN